MKTPGIRYGHDRDGNEIYPKDGERILEEGEPLPAVYRPWLNGSGWLSPCKLHTHPGANQSAQVFGNYWAYAVPTKEHVPTQAEVVAKPTEDVLDVPVVVSETPAAPDPAPVITVEEIRAKKAKHKQQMRASFGLEFDD
jgi:hypothetical protein